MRFLAKQFEAGLQQKHTAASGGGLTYVWGMEALDPPEGQTAKAFLICWSYGWISFLAHGDVFSVRLDADHLIYRFKVSRVTPTEMARRFLARTLEMRDAPLAAVDDTVELTLWR